MPNPKKSDLWQTLVIPRSTSGLPATRQVCTARGSDWMVDTEWDARGGRLEPVFVTIRALHRERWVTSEVLRAIPLGELHRAARVAAANRWEEIRELHGEKFALRLLALAPAFEDLAVGPARGVTLSDDELEQVAAVYRNAWSEGRPVTKAVADTFQISKSTAGKRIMKARRAGLLDGIGRSSTQ